MNRLPAIALLLPIAACTVGPDYRPPQLSTPAAFQEDKTPEQTANPDSDLSRWWLQFHDAKLEQLVSRALTANLDIKIAMSRIRQAREQETVQAAAGLPSLNATGAAVQLHSNSNPLAKLSGGANDGSGTASDDGTDLRLYSAGFDASWEVDLFGGARRGLEAAQANSEAAVWALRDVEVSLTAEVANDYLSLRATQGRIAIVRAALQRQQAMLSVVQARAATGFVTVLDVNQQTAQVEATASQLPPLEAQARALVHALGVLLGEQPETMTAELQAVETNPDMPVTLPAGLPSDLLRRRPDIREAERKLATATAQIGVAVAQLYPKFNLLGLASFAGNSVSGLFSTDNFSAGGIGMIAWPIFTAGRAQANVHINEETEKQAYLAYQQSVLRALQDVEDSLARYHSEQQRLQSLQRSVAAAKSSSHIAQDQYRAGLAAYVTVLTAEATLLDVQDQAAQSRATVAADIVSLYKALGGGWSA